MNYFSFFKLVLLRIMPVKLSNHVTVKIPASWAWSVDLSQSIETQQEMYHIERLHLVDKLMGLFDCSLKELFFITWL